MLLALCALVFMFALHAKTAVYHGGAISQPYFRHGFQAMAERTEDGSAVG